MRRLAAGTGFTGVGLLSAVAFVLNKSADFDPERTVLVLFLFGIALLVLGGSGYAVTQCQSSSADVVEPHRTKASGTSARDRGV